MRISYRKKQELKEFEKEGVFDFKIANPDFDNVMRVSDRLEQDIQKLKTLNLKTRVISNAIVEKAHEPGIMNKVLNEMFSDQDNLKEQGILLHKGSTYFYDIRNNDIIYFHFIDGIIVNYLSTKENKVSFESKALKDLNSDTRAQMTGFFAILAFIKYAQIETKILEANKKANIFNCKYLNETNFDIEIINSTWFTNLVKSEGFKVRGHFRLQPKKKDGKWTKELIWINDFDKTGYTAPAKKLSSSPSSII